MLIWKDQLKVELDSNMTDKYCRNGAHEDTTSQNGGNNYFPLPHLEHIGCIHGFTTYHQVVFQSDNMFTNSPIQLILLFPIPELYEGS